MKRYCIAGAGARALEMFVKPLTTSFCDVADIVGIYDINHTRAKSVSKAVDDRIPVYLDFDSMLRETRPDCVIITTVDGSHEEYIIKSLEAGIDVISEKPLAIDEIQCARIIETEKQTGKKVSVTFNCRYMPVNVRIKELLMKGSIGEVLHVDFEWLLDTFHGVDYFRRWHREMQHSGGLLVHKATHHFDLVNWWLDDEPGEVYANGSLRFYGDGRAERGLRCKDCQYSSQCKYKFQSQLYPVAEELYFKAEHEDLYYRDRCIFDDQIDICDTMSATVQYSRGTILTYSLLAYSPYEGWRISFTGTRGRIEVAVYLSGVEAQNDCHIIKLYKPQEKNRIGEMITYSIPKGSGKHGGADEVLREALFRNLAQNSLQQSASSYDGVKAVMIGVCANRSILENRSVVVREQFRRAIAAQEEGQGE